MHARAIIRGCLLACTLGMTLVLLFIVAAGSAWSSQPVDWLGILPRVLGAGALLAVPLTGLALLGAWFAAQRNAVVRWWMAALAGVVLFALGGLTMAGGLQGWPRMAMLFGPMGGMTFCVAWLCSFGLRPRVAFGTGQDAT